MGARGRRTAIVAIGGVAAVVAAPAARGAGIASGPTPLAFLSTTPSACPAAADVRHETAANAITKIVRGAGSSRNDERLFRMTLGLASVVTEPSATVVVCDPAAAAAAQPIGPIGGSLAATKATVDVAGPGLRARTAELASAAARLHVGDHLTFPAVSAAATVDLTVGTPSGASTARLGPFAAPPTGATIVGTETAPVIQIVLGDGTTAEQTVAIPPAVAPTLRVAAHGRKLAISARVAAGAIVVAQPPIETPEGQEPPFFPDPPSAAGIADQAGAAHMRTAALRPGAARVDVDVLDLAHQTTVEWQCQLRWKGERIRKVHCAPARVANAARLGARFGARASAERQALAAANAPTASAARAAAATTPARVDTIARIPDWMLPETADDLLAGDVTGDGLPEVALTDGGEHRLWASGTAGWRAAKLHEDYGTALALSDDLTGDGIGELWLADGHAVAGNRTWSSAALPTIDLRSTAALGAGDLLLPTPDSADADEAAPPVPLPDSNGDGRPELLVGNAVQASNALPIGRPTPLPGTWSIATADVWAARTGSLKSGEGEAGSADEPHTFSADGVAAPIVSAALSTRTAGMFQSTIGLAALPTAPPWTVAPPTTVKLPGVAAVVDADPLEGEALVVTYAEACKRFSCVARVRRITTDGRVIATLSGRVSSGEVASEDIDAKYVADGPDADDRPDVVVRESLGGGQEPIALWSSTSPTADLDTLPLLADGRRPIQTVGPLVPWHVHGAPAGIVTVRSSSTASRLPIVALQPGS